MRIKSVKIKNFRALRDAEIEFDSVTTFIGPNGVGKSTVLRALDWFFNRGKGQELTEDDYSFGVVDEDISVQVTFTDLTDTDREALGKYVTEGTSTFTAWKFHRANGEEILSANAKGYPDFTPIKAESKVAEKKKLYSALRSERSDLELPSAATGPAIEQAMTEWEANHVDQLEDVSEALETNFFGFNSGGKMSGLFDFVLVTADLRASEESTDGKSSIIGRILERSVDRTAADEDIARIVEESRQKQQDVYREKFNDQLEGLTTQLNEVVHTYAPDREVRVTPSEAELKAPRTTFSVSVLDGEDQTPVENQGHGFQRTLLVSALQVLAESGTAGDQGVICLAIEEPELFQHPIQAQTFAKVLRTLAEDSGKRIQITYATHSPYFVETRHFNQVRRLTRTENPTSSVTVHSATVDEVKEKLDGVTKAVSVESQLDSVIANQLPVALFAQRALIVEGTTESAVFHGIADRAGSGSLEAKGVAVVPAGGKSSIPLAHAILSCMGIPAYALFDGDGGFEDRAKANGKDQDKIENEKNGHVAANRSVLKYFGLDVADFPPSQIGESAAVFEDHLETFLTKEWPKWAESCTTVEKDTGVSLRKNQSVYRSATVTAEGQVPEMLEQVIAKAEGRGD